MAKQTPPLGEQQVTQVFRALAEEHLATRRRERDAAEQTWRRIQQRRGDLSPLRALPGPAPSRLRRWAWVSVPALAVAAGVAFALLPGAPAPLDYQLVGGTSQGELITTDSKPARLLFNDQSSIEAGTETTLSVHVVDDKKLVARLSQGKLKVHVVHNPETDWRFLAGPYEVQVVGTRFDLSWESDRSRLALVMHEGRVMVTGPGQKPRRVGAGEVLILDDQEASRGAAPESVDAPEDPSPATPETSAGPPKTRGGSQASAATQSWAQQVAAGQFDQVVRDAKKQGVGSALAQRSAADLQALAQAARYTGDTELAVQTWTAVRKRFAGQPASAQAAFFLGRIYDQLGRGQEALRWFDTYLTEAPTGVYASETLGRKLTLVRSLRGDDKAHEVAREYLARFPHGPYADTARDMLLNHD